MAHVEHDKIENEKTNSPEKRNDKDKLITSNNYN